MNNWFLLCWIAALSLSANLASCQKNTCITLINVSSPCNLLNIRNSVLQNNSIQFQHAPDYDIYAKTYGNFSNCIFQSSGRYTLVENRSKDKEVIVSTSGRTEMGKGFTAMVNEGPGRILVNSDLSGLKPTVQLKNTSRVARTKQSSNRTTVIYKNYEKD